MNAIGGASAFTSGSGAAIDIFFTLSLPVNIFF